MFEGSIWGVTLTLGLTILGEEIIERVKGS